MLETSRQICIGILLICCISSFAPAGDDASKIDMLLKKAGLPYAQAMNGYVKLERSIYETDELIADDTTIAHLISTNAPGKLVYKDSVDLFFEKKGSLLRYRQNHSVGSPTEPSAVERVFVNDPVKGANYYSEKDSSGQFITSPQIFDHDENVGIVVERGVTIPPTYNLVDLIFSIPVTMSRPAQCNDVDLTENENQWIYSINCLEDKQVLVAISRENEQITSCTTAALLPQGSYPMDTTHYQYPLAGRDSTTVPISLTYVQFKPINYSDNLASLDAMKSRASISTIRIVHSDFNKSKYAKAIDYSEAEGTTGMITRTQNIDGRYIIIPGIESN